MLNLISVLGLSLSILGGTAPDVHSVVTANNQLALDLYNQVRSQNGNVFFSPYSITKALGMVYAGACGDTAKEMAAVSHFTLGQDRQHHAFLEMRKLLNHNLGNQSGVGNLIWIKPAVQLHLSANLWGQRGCGFQKTFLDLLQECYGAGLQEVDFAASEAARQRINAWVEKQTNHKIQELFKRGMIDSTTRLVLASAIYFKGDWSNQFKKNNTLPQTFWSNATPQAQVPMMNQTDTFGYFENDELQGLQMLYQGKKLAMIILLPKKRDGLADLEKTLTADKLATSLAQLQEQKVEVALPKFKLTNDYLLNDTLAALGMKKAFAEHEADFSGMNGNRESLYIGEVVHKAFVDVNEEGTEAAAATGVGMHTISAAPSFRPRVPVFRADHPFVFAIRDVPTGVILFLGRVAKP